MELQISILSLGLKPKNRQYVHLSSDKNTAAQVGRRHGKLVILLVESGKMNLDGYSFFLSENNVWLADEVPSKYLKIL